MFQHNPDKDIFLKNKCNQQSNAQMNPPNQKIFVSVLFMSWNRREYCKSLIQLGVREIIFFATLISQILQIDFFSENKD